MSINELSELIAMGCRPELGSTTNSDGSSGSGIITQTHIYDEKRRLSVKQMTATELLSVRAASALEIKNALEKVSEPVKVASAPTTPLSKTTDSNHLSFPNKTMVSASTTSLPSMDSTKTTPKTPEIVMEFTDSNTYENKTYKQSRSRSPREDQLDAKVKILSSSPASSDRITLLPSVLDNDMVEGNFLTLNSSAGKITDALKETNLMSNRELTSSTNSLLENRSNDSDSPKSVNCLQPSSSNTSIRDMSEKNNFLMDSIELMRKQRLDCENSRERRSDSLLDERRLYNGRSAAPDRLHSSSISSMGSAIGGGGVSSVSVSLNPSKNTSRRNSNSSVMSEISTPATVLLPPTPPIFPLAKTSSAPNMERRRSSLSSIFPGASPLVVPEPVLHTDPKVVEEYTKEEITEIIEDTLDRQLPAGKLVHRTKTPPPVGMRLGVNLKKVTPPRTHIAVKKNEGPMLGVVLRKVEKKTAPQKSILDDDKPLYHLSIVRSDGKDHKASDHHATSKPKPKPIPLQKSATISSKPNPGGIFTGPQTTKIAQPIPQVPSKPQRPVPGVPITIQKIEGDKIIIIKKYIVPKNTKLPEHLMKIGVRISCIFELRRVLVLVVSRVNVKMLFLSIVVKRCFILYVQMLSF